MDAQPLLISQEVVITAGISLIIFLIGALGTIAAIAAKMLLSRFDTKIETCHAGLVSEVRHLIDYGHETRKIAIEAHEHMHNHVKDFHTK